MKISSWIKSKSKALDSTCRPCPNSVVDFPPQQSTMYNYQHPQNHLQSHPQPQLQQQVQPQLQMHPQQHLQMQPHTFHQPPICQQHQPMQTVVSPCPYLFQQPQQSVAPYAVQSLYQNHTIDARVTESAPVSSQTQYQLPHTMTALPVYQSGQVQSATISNQSSQYADNSFYYNHTAGTPMTVNQQQQQQQHHHHHQQQQQQPQQQTQYQIAHHQPQQQFQNNQQFHLQQHQLEEQRSNKLQQQHSDQSQFQQQSQQIEAQRHQQQQTQMRLHQQQQQEDSQQRYQNRQQVVSEAFYGNGNGISSGDGDLSLEAKCLMHESSYKELSKQACSLRNEFETLSANLELIRKRLPDYSVNEVKI